MEKKFEDIEQFKSQQHFKVPDNYFEEFALEMQHTIGDLQKEEPWLSKITRAFHLRLTIPLAAVLLLMISIGILNDRDQAALEFTYADATSYLLNEAELLEDEELYELAFSVSEADIIESDQDAIIDYLIEEEEIDLQDLDYTIN